MLFALRRATHTSSAAVPPKATDFHATLMFGAFMTFAGVFGLVAESAGASDSRWWFSASYAMQALGILIGESPASVSSRQSLIPIVLAQLAVVQLLTPDYLFGLLSIAAPPNGVPSWRIYALVLVAIAGNICRISPIRIYRPPYPIARVVRPDFRFYMPSASVPALEQPEPVGTTVYTKRGSRCTELGPTDSDDTAPLPVVLRFPRIWEFTFALQCVGAAATLCEIAEAAIGGVPALKLLAAMANVVWGGGVMTIHFVIIYEPTHQSSLDPVVAHGAHDLERIVDQPSEDFMTLRDPFASPTQIGLPLPPSPTAPRRTPRRRASEPLQLTRFGSFSGLHSAADEKQMMSEVDPDKQLLEALVRHALFSTGRPETGSILVSSESAPATPPKQLAQSVELRQPSERPDSPDCFSGASTPTIRQKRSKELRAPKAPAPAPAFPWHPFRPSTPPRPSRAACRTPPPKLVFPGPPSSIPFPSLSPAESGYSAPLTWSSAPSTYSAPPSPGGSDSGSSFVSPPPTPTPGPSGSKSNCKVRSLVPARPAPILAPAPVRRRGPGPA
ncbi:hypothetical protein FRC10_011286 [Ceratobasidium sp. 414]|nr:hypothetical protein FRC10_011286 [Ceratobasidium sp. 414]